MSIEGVNGLGNNSYGKCGVPQRARSFSGRLERTPQNDTVNFGSNTDNKISEQISYYDIQTLDKMTQYSRPSDWMGDYTMDMEGSKNPDDNFHIKVGNKLIGCKATGKIFNKDADLRIKSNFSSLSGTITGTIDGQNVNIKYKETKDRKGLEISGNIPNAGNTPKEDFVPVLALFAYNHAQQQQML